ncbi:MAG: MBL fold metallo-hydrolase [Gammaproteobacteria bacterium]|nr:MBL fold metallo-hydrolase [Gammaproteobacteria bacterium]
MSLKFLMLLFIAFFQMAIAENYPLSQVEMVLKKVSPHVYYVQGKAGIATDNEGFISNAVAVVTSEGIVVIDSLGSPSLAQLFVGKIRQISAQPIVKVIVTHYHADHIYGLQVFKELGAEIIAPAGYANYLDEPIAEERLAERRVSLKPWVNDKTRLIRPDQVIDKNESFQLGGVKFELNYLGEAHSDGDLSVLVKPDGVLVSGDIIFEGRIPFTGGADTEHWLTLLEKLDKSNLNVLIPGHGAAAKNPKTVVQLTLRYLRQVRAVMSAAVEEMTSFDEAYQAADWSEFEHLPAFEATHRRNAYGVYLSMERALLAE